MQHFHVMAVLNSSKQSKPHNKERGRELYRNLFWIYVVRKASQTHQILFPTQILMRFAIDNIKAFWGCVTLIKDWTALYLFYVSHLKCKGMQLYLSGASLLIVFEIPQQTLHKKLNYQKGANNTRALCSLTFIP